MRIGSASGIAGHGEFSLICPVPDGETLPFQIPMAPWHCLAFLSGQLGSIRSKMATFKTHDVDSQYQHLHKMLKP